MFSHLSNQASASSPEINDLSLRDARVLRKRKFICSASRSISDDRLSACFSACPNRVWPPFHKLPSVYRLPLLSGNPDRQPPTYLRTSRSASIATRWASVQSARALFCEVSGGQRTVRPTNRLRLICCRTIKAAVGLRILASRRQSKWRRLPRDSQRRPVRAARSFGLQQR